MILDTLENADRYAVLSPRFALAFDYLRSLTGTEAAGRVELDGDRVFAIVQTYTTKAEEDALFEAHRRYIDVQYLHAGRETILWAPLKTMSEVKMPYNDEKEAALFGRVPATTPIHMEAGSFAILYPEDAHAPCIHWDGPCEVFKVVVKVAVD